MENLVIIKEQVWGLFYGERKGPWDSSSASCISFLTENHTIKIDGWPLALAHDMIIFHN